MDSINKKPTKKTRKISYSTRLPRHTSKNTCSKRRKSKTIKKKRGGASNEQKGDAATYRNYFYKDPTYIMNQIVHSGDPNPDSSIFTDPTNSYDDTRCL